MLEDIRKKHSKLHYIYSYIDDNSCNAEWDEASKAIDTLLSLIDKYEKVLKDLSANWDHDNDAHRYGTPCRVCMCEIALDKNKALLCKGLL